MKNLLILILFTFISINSLIAQNISSPVSFDSSNSAVPACENSLSDPDGDGWGWENQKSCKVGGEFIHSIHPICESSNSDPDGDGWGWENQKSCKVQDNSSAVNSINNTSQNNFLKTEYIKTENISSNEIKVDFELSEAGPAFIEYGFSKDNLEFKGPVENNSLVRHVQRIRNLISGEKYFFTIVSNGIRSGINTFTTTIENNSSNQAPTIQAANNNTSTTDPVVTQPSIQPTSQGVSTGSSSFAEIKKNGLSNGCYPDEDHYLAEYLFQNPDACFWKVDKGNKKISTVSIPKVPNNAVKLPNPSGGDDTKALQAVINSNKGGAVVGSGTYKVNGLKVNVPIDIFHMKMEPAGSAKDIVTINSPDVRIFHSPIDGKNSKTLEAGFRVPNGSHRFTLVKSGLSNVYHTKGASMAGVIIRAVSDFHIACNTFENLINTTSDKTKTARANSIWLTGGKTGSTSGGYIVNNFSKNHQSNGSRHDSEFFTIQGYASTDKNNPVRIFGNYTVDPGKRFTKHQESDALVLSNHYEWTTKSGPLGNRKLLSHATVQFSDNIIIRNNRVVVAAQSRFDYIANINMHAGRKPLDNIHFDCNDIEIKDKLPSTSGNVPKIIAFRSSEKPKNSTNWPATNSTAKNNYIHGNGSVKYHYVFGAGYHDDGRDIDHSGNIFNIPALSSVYQ